MRFSCLCIALLSGCGRFGFDDVGTIGDANPDVISDAFDLTMPFSTPVALTSLNNTLADDDPSLTGDLLEIIFDSERMGTSSSDLLVARRATLADPWSVPAIITELASVNDEDTPCLSRDGLIITLSSDRAGTIGMNDLWTSTRTSRTAAWATPVRIPELSTVNADDDLSRTADELLGMFTSDRPGGMGGFDIYMTTRAQRSDPWGTPVLVPELNSTSYDQDPTIDASGTILVFSSTRTSDQNLYMATRPDRSSAFSAPVPISTLNTNADESDPWLSPDLRTIVFTRGTDIGRDLYFATR
ncbi:MAG: hypothetical protein ABI175_05840 [Polyangiales bacterium]